MTDTAATEETTIETPPPEPQKDEALANKHGYIDLEKIEDPETRKQVQDRLNNLYHSNKENTAALHEMQSLYGGMQKKLSEFEARDAKKANDTQVAEIKKGIADANAKGDYERASDLQEKLVDAKAPKPAPQTQEQDSLSPAQERQLFAWQAEMTEDGRILRPWANANSPKYRETIGELTKAYSDPSISGQGFQAVLDAVHEKMAPKPKQTSPVADGGDTTPRRQSKTEIRLTPQEERVARRMYPNEADPIKAYTDAKKKYG